MQKKHLKEWKRARKEDGKRAKEARPKEPGKVRMMLDRAGEKIKMLNASCSEYAKRKQQERNAGKAQKMRIRETKAEQKRMRREEQERAKQEQKAARPATSKKILRYGAYALGAVGIAAALGTGAYYAAQHVDFEKLNGIEWPRMVKTERVAPAAKKVPGIQAPKEKRGMKPETVETGKQEKEIKATPTKKETAYVKKRILEIRREQEDRVAAERLCFHGELDGLGRVIGAHPGDDRQAAP